MINISRKVNIKTTKKCYKLCIKKNKEKRAATLCAGDNMRKQDISEISVGNVWLQQWFRKCHSLKNKIKKKTHEVLYETATVLLDNKDLRSCKNLYTNAYRSIICNNTKLGITQMPFSGWMSKQTEQNNIQQ